jgi:hypothetical protein
MKSDPTCLNCNSTPDYRVERHDININLRVLFTISCCKFTVNFIAQCCNFKTLQTRSFPTPLTVTIKFTSQNLGGTWPAAARVSLRWQKERPWERGWIYHYLIEEASNGHVCGAILPQKMFEIWSTEMPFPAFWASKFARKIMLTILVFEIKEGKNAQKVMNRN